jgi:DNA polymerase-3 subunit alpha
MEPDKMQYLSDVIALYRPGPLGSGMVEDFIECRHGRKDPNYPHPVLEPVLKDTFGVPVYQEQVMRMAQDLAGYTLGGADILRRAMGKKKASEMAKQRKIFVKGSHEKNDVSPELANEIFDLMANFASYGFNKAHTIAYALIAYQTAWIKANHPLEFMAASMTMDRGNSDKVLKFKQELDRTKVPLLLPNVNKSELIFRVEENKAIRFALGGVKGAGDESMKALVKERNENGLYKDIFDFVERQDPHFMNRRQFEALIKAGAFDTLEASRGFLMANVDMLLSHMQATFAEKNSNQIGLFGEAASEGLARPTLTNVKRWDLFEVLENEYIAIGFYLSAHPLDSFREELSKVSNLVNMTDLEELAGKKPKSVKVAALIMGKRELKTKKGDRMAILTLSDLSGMGEVALFPESYDNYYDLIQKNQAVLCTLNVSHDGERLRVNMETMQDLDRALTKQDKLLLKIENMESISYLKQILETQERGQTMCEIFYTVPNLGHAHVKLNKGIHASKRFMAKLDTLPDVTVFH